VYGAEIVEADGPEDIVALCRDRGIGLEEATVMQLLGPDTTEKWRRARRDRTRSDLVRLAAALIVVALLVVAGLTLAADPPGERVLKGRTGEITVESR
jgi:hypothetical protein